MENGVSKNGLALFIAEDDDDDFELLLDVIDSLEIPITINRYVDGIELLTALSERRPDILFLDINMPQKNGFESLLEIRQNNLYDDMAIIVYSTSSTHSIIKRIFDGGADAFLVKPDDYAVWKTTIRKALETRWAALRPAKNLENFVLTSN